jgi:hypothetical protein
MWVLASATGLLPSLADALATDALGAEVAAGQHQPTTGLCGAAALLAGDTGPLADAARAVIATTLSLGTTLAGVEDVATSFVARISSMDSGAGCAIGAHPTLEGVSSGTAVRQHTAVTDHDICARDVGAGRSNKRRPDATVSLPSDSASAAVLMKRSAFVPLALKKEAAVLIHNVISVAFRYALPPLTHALLTIFLNNRVLSRRKSNYSDSPTFLFNTTAPLQHMHIALPHKRLCGAATQLACSV